MLSTVDLLGERSSRAASHDLQAGHLEVPDPAPHGHAALPAGLHAGIDDQGPAASGHRTVVENRPSGWGNGYVGIVEGIRHNK